MAEKESSFGFSEQIERLKDAAYRDSLTGLLNRGAAEIYIENAIAHMKEGESCMMIIVDLDNFKTVNDTLGHQAGDKVICTAANILSGLFRPGDIVARLGGDEYIVFLCGNVTKKLAAIKGKDICGNLQLTVGDRTPVTISSSAGIYFSSDSSTSFQEMYRMADTALYQAKNSGKNKYFINEDDSFTAGELEEEIQDISTVKKDTRSQECFCSSIVIINNARDAKIIYGDSVFGSMSGLKEDEIEGQILTDYIHPDDVVGFRMITENLAENKGTSVQVRLRSPKGNWFYNKISAVSIEYDNSRCILLNLCNMLQSAGPGAMNKSSRRNFKDNTEQNSWEVDLATKQFRFYSNDDTFLSIENENCVFPYDLINSGWIAPVSVGRFMKFATGIFTGRIRGYGNFLIRSGDSLDYAWATLSYRTQGDKFGVPFLVTGDAKPIDADIQVKKVPFSQKNTIPVPVIDGLIAKFDANITKDYVNKLWIEGKYQEQEYSDKKIAHFVVNEVRKIYDRSDKVDFTNYFSRENLLNLFHNGTYWFFVEYRRIDSSGYIEWVTLAMNLYRKTMGEDILVRLSINNCDDRHIWECYSSQEDIRSNETNLYSISAVKEMMNGLQAEASNEFCAAVLIRIAGMKKLFHGNQDKIISSGDYIISMLSYALGTRCIGAKADEEHYLFIFPDIYSSSYLNRVLEMAFNYTRLLLSDIMPANAIHFLAAAACMPLKNAEYDSILSLCRRLEDNLKDENEDKIVFHSNGTEVGPDTALQNLDYEKKITIIDSSEKSLSDSEQILFSDCLSDMLLAPSSEKGLQTLFQRLGNYYLADRIYIISLENRNRDVEVFCEWRLPHLETISIYLSRTSMDKLQMLTRCSIEKKPMHYYAKASVTPDENEENENEWHYCIFPVCFSENAYTVTDFLCIENPKKKQAEYTLVNKLIPYIKNQKLKSALHADNTALINKNSLENIPNLLAYIHAIPEFLALEHSSMGAYLAKVPRLSILNSHHGYEYGRVMLRYIADTFGEVIGYRYLFRTWDNEFIALFPDISKENAEEKFKRLKITFEKRYGENIFVNYRWKEEPFTSRELMDMPKSGIRGNIIDVEKYLKSYTPEIPDIKIGDCRFTVYMQPVFNIKTDKIAGAELLVRGVEKNGELILPHRFLKKMEHDHTIKNLDMFVLEQALAILDGWRKQGLEEIPISVNFSKTTILDNTVLASYLAVRSRYPHLGSCKIGIELPQNIGEENYSKLASVIAQMKEFGAEFIIDDIGVDKGNIKLLDQIRFDTVKIDQSLIVELEFNESTRETIRSIVNSCMEQKAYCVAEGVETKEQFNIVRKLGCLYAQGFYYDRPMTVEEFNRKYMKKPCL